MTINWQAKDSEGNIIDCSMTIEVGSSGILEVIGEPKFGDLKFTSSLSEEEGNKILKLVEQNKEVFINGETLYQAFVDIGRNVSDQPIQENETFIRNPPESPQSPTPDSSGYSSPSTPSSRRSSLSLDEEEYEQDELENRTKELEEENAHLRTCS
jgi:hypothetical protein